MAKGSAELSEFAPTKFEPMIDAGAAKLSAVLTSCKHLAMFMHAGQPKCPNLAARGHDDTPSYNDPSKFGGSTALPIEN
jgi:hypothetical protein